MWLLYGGIEGCLNTEAPLVSRENSARKGQVLKSADRQQE
jgi:hypothetical protein